MYRCVDCGRFFEEPIVEHDDPSPAGVSLPSGYYTYWYCPHCGSEDIEDAGECKSCGEPVEKGVTLCEDCRKELVAILQEVAKEMKLSNEEMEDAIWQIYEW